jgi:hypothetical protein
MGSLAEGSLNSSCTIMSSTLIILHAPEDGRLRTINAAWGGSITCPGNLYGEVPFAVQAAYMVRLHLLSCSLHGEVPFAVQAAYMVRFHYLSMQPTW